jgi:hypothetical protein
MGWQVGFDSTWNRDIGYGVPAICDRPECGAEINRGLTFVCGGEPYGGEAGCGLYFCDGHLSFVYDSSDESVSPQLCERCVAEEPPFDPTPDPAEWLNWKLTDESWAEWRQANPEEAERIKALAGTKG